MQVTQNLHDRQLDCKLHRVFVDEREGTATFPLYDFAGRMVGFQQYRPDSQNKGDKNNPYARYFLKLSKGERCVWGLESLNLSHTLFVLEGIFDASRLTSRGFSALAVLRNNPLDLMGQFYLLTKTRRLVFVCDAGQGGKPMQKLAQKLNVDYHVMEDDDMGSVSDSYVDQFIAQYI